MAQPTPTDQEFWEQYRRDLAIVEITPENNPPLKPVNES